MMYRFTMIFSLILVVFLTGIAVSSESTGASSGVSTIGMEGVVSVEIDGALVVAKRVESGADLDVSVLPIGGHSYEVRFTGNVAGTYDLADALCFANGEELADDVSIPVKVDATLSEDFDGELIPEEKGEIDLFRSYNVLMVAVGLVWLALLVPLTLWGRKKAVEDSTEHEHSVRSIADILRPLLDEARENKLDADGKARLEKAIYVGLKERLGMDGASPLSMIEGMKKDVDTAKAISVLEAWLHKSPAAGRLERLSEKQLCEISALVADRKSITLGEN